MMLALSLLDPWVAFQCLILASVVAAGVFSFFCARVYGACAPSAVAGGLFYGLGPAMIARLGDTPAVVAAPHLPLLLLCAERVLRGGGASWGVALASGFAALLLSGSPDMALAGVLCLVVRLACGWANQGQGNRLWQALLCLAAGALLAAPQWIPTMLAWPGSSGLSGATGWYEPPSFALWLVDQVSHSPAAALCVAALPLAGRSPVLRTFLCGAALGIMVVWLVPFGAASAPLLLVDLILAVTGALTLSQLLALRRTALGRQARIWYLFACLAAAVALSVTTSTLGPLPQTLAGAVGAFAIAQIVFFVWGASESLRAAHLFLLPLSLSFVLQPSGRSAWETGLRREVWEAGSATRDAVARVISWRTGSASRRSRGSGPRETPSTSASATWASSAGDGMRGGSAGSFPGRVWRRLASIPRPDWRQPRSSAGEPGRLAFQGVRFVQVPVPELSVVDAPSARIEIEVRPERPRLVPFPISTASAVRLESALSDAVDVEAGATVAELTVRLASGREISIPLRAGIETGEWARQRPDVRERLRHPRPSQADVIADGSTYGERYGCSCAPGTIRVHRRRRGRRSAGRTRLSVFRLGLVDEAHGAHALGDACRRLRERHARGAGGGGHPLRPLLRGAGERGPRRVVSSIATAPDERGLQGLLAAPVAFGIDPRRTCRGHRPRDARTCCLPRVRARARPKSTYRRGRVHRRTGRGPGLLVVSEGWAPGLARVARRPIRRPRAGQWRA